METHNKHKIKTLPINVAMVYWLYSFLDNTFFVMQYISLFLTLSLKELFQLFDLETSEILANRFPPNKTSMFHVRNVYKMENMFCLGTKTSKLCFGSAGESLQIGYRLAEHFGCSGL